MLEADDFQSGGPGHGVFLEPKAMKRFFAEYERWMLNKNGQDACFRECLRREVENLCAALRQAAPFAPWRFRDKKEEEECNTLSATT